MTPLDYFSLSALRNHNPALRLLRSDHLALVASFLHRVFVVPNQRVLAAPDKAWLAQLTERQFVGTESRLLTLFDLLKQINEGSQADPVKRMADLPRKRDEIDAEINRNCAESRS